METKERSWANDDSRAAIEARAAFFCEVTETALPKLTFRNGKLMANDALLDWIKQQGVSLDWLATGDPRCMITSYRNNDLGRRQFAADVARLDEREKQALLFVLQAVVNNEVNADQAFPMLSKMLRERREQLAAP